MLKKMKKVLLYACLCGLFSACATTGGASSEVNKIGIKTANISPTTQASPITNAFFKMVTTALVIYTVGKIPNGPTLAQLVSNHRLRQLEIENRLASTISVANHTE